MSLKILYTGKFRNGTPVPDIAKMVHYNHPEVEFIPYTPEEKGDVILCVNRTMAEDERSIRKVMYLGSVPTFKKSKLNRQFSSIDHVIFISDYCSNLFLGGWDFEKYSTVLTFGSLPMDECMIPIKEPRTIDGPIQFVAVAKWYKRRYKRLKQIKKLFNGYLKGKYPDSILHIIGDEEEKKDGDIYSYKKTFHDQKMIDIFKNSHIQLMPTPFDTGPKTIAESLHYRVPFVCSNNCAGAEYINKLGKCGIVVDTDPHIGVWKQYLEYGPLDIWSDYNKNEIPYRKYTEAVEKIVNNFEEYTSWRWNEKLNYKKQSDNLYNILKGS